MFPRRISNVSVSRRASHREHVQSLPLSLPLSLPELALLRGLSLPSLPDWPLELELGKGAVAFFLSLVGGGDLDLDIELFLPSPWVAPFSFVLTGLGLGERRFFGGGDLEREALASSALRFP